MPLIAPIASATATPTLSLSYTGSGDNVQINVTGAPNTSVLLFYTSTGSGSQFSSLGTTNSSGVFSIIVSSATYGIVPNSLVHVALGGISGAQSSGIAWPYFQSTTASTLTLSQTALLLNAGQTSTITASVNYLYLLNNSNPSIANINFNASQITIQALTYGSTVANICAVGSTTNCSSVTITVQNSSTQQLSFSQNNFSIISGQSVPVTIIGGSGLYTISNNSNSSAVQANLSGSTITLTASGTSGASSITVCTTDLNYCGIINTSATTVNSSAITFSQTSPIVSIGQSTTVTIYGGVSGSNFYVSSNSNPSIVQANINSNILTLVANASTGTSTVIVCAYGGSCGSLVATVTTAGNSNGPILLSQNTISILAGQSSNITISGGSTPYSISSNSPNIFQGAISGNTLTVYGVNPGSATANICASAGCTTLSVIINSVTSSTNTTQLTFSQNNILLNVGQQVTVYISGNGNYYVGSNNNPNAASAVLNGGAAIVTATSVGSSSISICQNGGQCSTLYVSVGGTAIQNSSITLSSSSQSVPTGNPVTFTVYASNFTNPSYSLKDSFSGTTISNTNINSSGVFSWTPAASDVGVHNITIYASDTYGHSANATAQITVSAPSVSQPSTASPAATTQATPAYSFTRTLKFGMSGEDVFMLQKFLNSSGFQISSSGSGSPGHETENFGAKTKAALIKFQKAHNINPPIGNFGPITRSFINSIQGG